MKNSALSPVTPQAAGDGSPFAQAGLNRLIDQMIERYVSWREECAALDTAYENWSRAGREDRNLAYSAYTAALDREEQAAAIYQSLAERIPRA